MKLSFYGGVQQVTGSNYLLEIGKIKVLVDCGLFQGSRFAETLNYSPFPYDPREINFVLLTHSHADHSGRLPKLYKDGFRGKIFATKPTIDLSAIALDDNLDLIKDEAKRDGHAPLFDSGDLHQTFLLAHGVEYQEEISLGDGVTAIFHDAGHILGSAIIEISWRDDGGKIQSIYFSGDLGNYPVPLLRHYDMPNEADYIVVESTYGDRLHSNTENRKEILRQEIDATVKRGGTVIIPSFAIERTQDLLYELNELIEHNELPRVPVFLDSPLAIKLTKVYKNYESYFNKKVIHEIRSGDDIFNFPGLKMAYSSKESKAIDNIRGSKIVIAGSGMSLGGRIVFHEMRYLPDPNSTILFIGYQVENSPGRQILDGKKEIKLLGQNVQVNCDVRLIEGYSAHADQAMLMDWVGKAKEDGRLKKVFVTHGEYHSSSILCQKIRDDMAIDAVVPGAEDSYEL
ncbi:MAG: MBL fold metallo-hydrolase [Candidatus Yanofskybacteria bacterium]|nr:MBL fold metallo-hydrolase [Candidatus Yanofskybacteria bacterium]